MEGKTSVWSKVTVFKLHQSLGSASVTNIKQKKTKKTQQQNTKTKQKNPI